MKCKGCKEEIELGQIQVFRNDGFYHSYCADALPEVKDVSKGDKHMEICNRLNTLYRQKNADYGDSYGEQFQEYGPVAGILYLENKIRRIKQLVKNPAQVKGESLLDSSDDLINYAAMFRIEIEEWLKSNETHSS